MPGPASLLPPVGSCLIDATQAQFHRTIPTKLRLPLLGGQDWRVSRKTSERMMERRGWLQTVCMTVTTPEQIAQLAPDCTQIYIPGEFSRQGDVLNAAATSARIIFLERGAFLAPNDLARAIEKLGDARERVIIVEAGSAFGYSDRVLDPRALEVSRSLGCPLAVNLNALAHSAGMPYEHRPQWINNDEFDAGFVRTALAFDARYLILPSGRDLHPAAAELWLSAQEKRS